MTQDRLYYCPVPEVAGRHAIAGGWTRFSRVEILQRGAPARLSEDIPAPILDSLTAPRAPVMGLAMDRPRIMGIVNATPDSFSDGGTYDPVAQGRQLLADGAEILDIGGESTRPGAAEVPVFDEIARVTPFVRALAPHAPISVDTRKAAVARDALKAGAMLINDVSGFDFDPDLPALVARTGAPVCLMHAQGLPDTMQDDPRYGDVLLDVYDALEARIARAVDAGIRRDRIVIDPGIGFGKTAEHNLAILRRIALYHGLGCPILLGVSRKRFIGTVGGAATPADRAPGTLALTLAAVQQGVQIHRVHDVAVMAQGLRLWQALNDNEKAER
jgi:dihydropteroate synthase